MTRFKKVLIANRGEIASRIIRTCHSMGIGTVAVFSDADREALFVQEADEAIAISATGSKLSYLCGAKIIDVARRLGVDAIHPGYGFLSEDANFATSCSDLGIAFIGPRPETIAALADKAQAKASVTALGVPTIPQYDLANPDSFEYPLLLKASCGGGGKGMQLVRSPTEFPEALESVKRIAKRAFGDDTILIERLIESPRHIEIQILGDQHGGLIHLGERECSIQRRHQKIIEESPAPGLSKGLRENLIHAALSIGHSFGYQSAGTVEFIVDSQENFFFLEVNTRLQVEHTITECITGLDIVRQQITIAQGDRLSHGQEDVTMSGHALQCRLYAEDVANEFMPSSGVLTRFHYNKQVGLRVDTGVSSGFEVSIHYDPMLAKFISHAPSRDEAIGKMSRALTSLCAFGITTNRRLLLDCINHPAYLAGQVNTSFLDANSDLLTPAPTPPRLRDAALLAATFWHYHLRRIDRTSLPSLVPGFRNNRWREERVGFQVGETEYWIGYLPNSDGSLQMRNGIPGVGLSATELCDSKYQRVEIAALEADKLSLHIGDHIRHLYICTSEKETFVLIAGHLISMREIPLFPDLETGPSNTDTCAPMPGKIASILVTKGQAVRAGETLLILEAMKMEHRILAQFDGQVEAVLGELGGQVTRGEILIVVTPD